VTVDLFRQALRRRVTGERLVRRFQNVSGQISWDGRDSQGRRLPDGHYLVRFASRAPNGQPDERRFALVRRNGRFTVLKGRPERQDQCGLLRRWKLLRPVFGGTGARPLVMSFRFGSDTRASIVVRRGGRVIKRFAEQGFRGGVLHRKRINVKLARRLARGRYRITINVRDGDRTISSSLAATRV
jgi:hypothetical protein